MEVIDNSRYFTFILCSRIRILLLSCSVSLLVIGGGYACYHSNPVGNRVFCGGTTFGPFVTQDKLACSCSPGCGTGKSCTATDTCGGCTATSTTATNCDTCTTACANGGTCISTDTCDCGTATSGYADDCDTCNTPCDNGGTCVGTDTCDCGTATSTYTADCDSCNECQNGGTCTDTNTCNCEAEWEGDVCDEHIYPDK